jgi:hypothetical protein
MSDPDNMFMTGNVFAQSSFPQAFGDRNRLGDLIAGLHNIGTVRMRRLASS